MRRFLTVLVSAAALAACDDDTPMPLETDPGILESSLTATGPTARARYEVRITNLTSGQPFTPPLTVTHRPPLQLFEPGTAASFEIQQIAENGNLEPMLTELQDARHAHDVVVALGDPVPPLLPGEERVYEIEAARGARLLSLVAMLVCTNDGFTGVRGLALPRDVGESASVYLDSYDAGTELNTEDFDDLVPPCGPLTGVDSGGAGTGATDPALAENGVIRHHPGIEGEADLLVEIHGWTDPVAQLVVTRIQ